MSDTEEYLHKAYGFEDTAKTESFYDDWAKSYDAEIAKNGYVTPGRCVDALLQLDPARSGPVIDLGCGTGLAGLALRKAGFEPVDGVDFSEGMLAIARTHNVYRDLWQGDLAQPVETPHGLYAHAVAAGVISPGHAPCQAVFSALDTIRPGGVLVFSLNDHALADRAYTAAVNEAVDGGAAELVFKEHGEHLPGTGLMATVFALRKR